MMHLQRSFTMPARPTAAPSSPSSVGSREEEELDHQSPSEKGAERMYKTAKMFFKAEKFGKAVEYLDKSLALCCTSSAQSLRQKALESLKRRGKINSRVLSDVTNNCPTLDVSSASSLAKPGGGLFQGPSMTDHELGVHDGLVDDDDEEDDDDLDNGLGMSNKSSSSGKCIFSNRNTHRSLDFEMCGVKSLGNGHDEGGSGSFGKRSYRASTSSSASFNAGVGGAANLGLNRTSTSMSDGFAVANKPPKLQRSQSFKSCRKSMTMSPGTSLRGSLQFDDLADPSGEDVLDDYGVAIGSSKNRKRHRKSLDTFDRHRKSSDIFEFRGMASTLEDDDHHLHHHHSSSRNNTSMNTGTPVLYSRNNSFRTAGRDSIDSTVSSTTASSVASSINTDFDRTTFFSPGSFYKQSSCRRFSAECLPTYSESPPFLPNNRRRNGSGGSSGGRSNLGRASHNAQHHGEELLFQEGPPSSASGNGNNLPPRHIRSNSEQHLLQQLASTNTSASGDGSIPLSNSMGEHVMNDIFHPAGLPMFTESPPQLNRTVSRLRRSNNRKGGRKRNSLGSSGGKGGGGGGSNSKASRTPPSTEKLPKSNLNTTRIFTSRSDETGHILRGSTLTAKGSGPKLSSSGGKAKPIPPTPSYQQANRMPFTTPTREELLNAMGDIDVSEQVQACKIAGIKMVALDFDNTFVNIHTDGKWRHAPAELEKLIRPVFRLLLPALLNQGIIVAIVTFSAQTDIISELLRISFPDHVRLGENVFICGATTYQWSSSGQRILSSSSAVAETDLNKSSKSSDDDDNQMMISTPNHHQKPPLPTTARSPNCVPMSPCEDEHYCEKVDWFSPTREGKKGHIETVCRDYKMASGGKEIFPHEVLLIDDDKNNIMHASRNNVRAIWFQAQEGPVGSQHILLGDMLRMIE